MLQSYLAWSRAQKMRMEETIKKTFDIFKRDVLSSKAIEAKCFFLQNLINTVLKEVNYCSIVIFNLFFNTMDFWKVISNNPFQTIIKNLIEKDSFYDRIFQYLDELANYDLDKNEKNKQ